MSDNPKTGSEPQIIKANKKRHIGRNIGIIIGAVILVSIIANALSGGSSTSSSTARTSAPTGNPKSSSTTAGPATTASLASIGTKVYDGDFAFVLNNVNCGAAAAAAVNNDGFGENIPAGAQECLVSMTVTNDKSQAQTFFDSNQYAYDAQNRQFSADTTGSIYLQGDQDATQVNPGVTINAVVPFQIPQNDAIVKLELHDSGFSNGVAVSLK